MKEFWGGRKEWKEWGGRKQWYPYHGQGKSLWLHWLGGIISFLRRGFHYHTVRLRARLVVRGFPNLDNHKTKVAAGNRNNLKLPLWGIFKPQEVCLVTKKTNLKKVTWKNQNNYYENNIGTFIAILIFKNFYSESWLLLWVIETCAHTVLKWEFVKYWSDQYFRNLHFGLIITSWLLSFCGNQTCHSKSK